jgi:phage shock protein A
VCVCVCVCAPQEQRSLKREVEFVIWQREELKKMIAQYDSLPELREAKSASVAAASAAPSHTEIQAGGSEVDDETDMRAFHQYPSTTTTDPDPTATAAATDSAGTASSSSSTDAHRIQELERMLAGKEQEATDLKQALAAVEKEAGRLGDAHAELERRLGRGEFNPETSKVLHLKNGPEVCVCE